MAHARFAKFAVLALGLGLGACSTFGGSSSSSGESGGNIFRNLLVYGGTTVPPSMPTSADKLTECPTAAIRDGGAVLRAGKGQAVSSQMTIRTVVRECAKDGTGLIVKVGIEGVALIGAAGKPGPVSGPITITVDRDGKPLSSRATRATTTVGADGHAIFSLVEEGIKVPPGEGETVITVGFKN